MAKNDKYTDPSEVYYHIARDRALKAATELRTEIKEDVQAGDKGGNPGQWSARKAQMMASKYKEEMHKRGKKPYTTEKSQRSESQKHLSNWTDEDWQTSDGKMDAKQKDGSMKRYLPKKAWEDMSEKEKKETDEKKLEGGKNGKQFISNTDKAKNARRSASKSTKANEAEDKSNKDANEERNTRPKSSGNKFSKSESDKKESDVEDDVAEVSNENDAEYDFDENMKTTAKKAKVNDGTRRVTRSMTNDRDEKLRKSPKSKSRSRSKGGDDRKEGEKSKKPASTRRPGSKANKKSESAKLNEKENENSAEAKKGDDEHGEPCTKTRLPKKGQHVFWRSTPGWVEGTVLEILYTNKSVDGIQANASKDDPRIALKSAESGKTAVHKPGSVYF